MEVTPEPGTAESSGSLLVQGVRTRLAQHGRSLPKKPFENAGPSAVLRFFLSHRCGPGICVCDAARGILIHRREKPQIRSGCLSGA